MCVGLARDRLEMVMRVVLPFWLTRTICGGDVMTGRPCVMTKLGKRDDKSRFRGEDEVVDEEDRGGDVEWNTSSSRG
jgi:hypothetical protein